MSISVGGIDIASTIINLEYELARTQRILEWLLANNSSLRPPPPNVMARIDEEAFLHLKKKFPEAGIQRTRGGAA
ncbi:MAG: hypothetical protein RI988_3567 [Pseudomonadota bacterium]|jgi:hypothetical protein